MKTCIHYIFYQGKKTIYKTVYTPSNSHHEKTYSFSLPWAISHLCQKYLRKYQTTILGRHAHCHWSDKKTETGTHIWRETRLAKQTEKHVKAEPWDLPLDSSHVERISETGQGRFCEGVAYGRMPREARQQSIVRVRNKSVDVLLTLFWLHKRRCTTTSRCPLHVIPAVSGLWLC